MALRPAHFAVALIVLVAAFGAAFALGKATADDEPAKPENASAQRVAVPSSTGVKVKLAPVGSLPRLRPSETSTATATPPSGPSESSGSTTEAAPAPVTPTPVAPESSGPTQEAPQTETPVIGGDE